MDACDFRLCLREFQREQRRWGRNTRFTVDCFATRANTFCDRFFSRFLCDGTSGVDAYAFDWSDTRTCGGDAGDDDGRPLCWLHPPRCLVARTIDHLRRCGGRGSVVVPFDRSEAFWPLVDEGAPGVLGVTTLWRRRGLVSKSGVPCARGFRDLRVVRFDFRGVSNATGVRRIRARIRAALHRPGRWTSVAA